MKFFKTYLKKGPKGIAFLTTVIILGIIVLICAGLSALVLRDTYTVKKIRYETQAYFLAEAGAERAIQILYDKSFDTTTFPMDGVILGAGTYSVSLDTSRYESDKLVLIISTGTVGAYQKKVEVLVRDNTLDAFDYPVLGGGRIFIAGGLTLIGGPNTEIWGGDVCSNNSNQNWAVMVGALLTSGYVDEDVYACGKIVETSLGIINGAEYPDSPAVDLPPFDAAFFDYYKDLAQNGGVYYSGSQDFPTGTYTPANGVIFVNGVATVNGNVTINGCLVATGNIWINPDFGSSNFTLDQVENLPALMSKGGNIGIYSASRIEGLIYSSNVVTTFALPSGIIDIDGAVIGKGGIYLYAVTNITFVRQNPPGIPQTESPLRIVCWNG